MSNKELGMMIAGAILFSVLALRGAIYLVDTYAFGDDANEYVVHRR